MSITIVIAIIIIIIIVIIIIMIRMIIGPNFFREKFEVLGFLKVAGGRLFAIESLRK
jgi:hypothetical protein